MKIQGQAALVTGGASGLGAATARELARRGAKVAILDLNTELAAKVAAEIGGVALKCDITDTYSVTAALDAAEKAHGPARIVMNIAGIGTAKRVVQKDGTPAPLEDFERVILVNTASAAAFDGQVGQEAYSASKGGLAAMTLPLARDLAQFGVRACTIAPGLFLTPLLAELPQAV